MTFKFWSILIIIFSYSLFLLCTSLCTYLMFYHFMIPINQVNLPVHFDFTPPPPHTTHIDAAAAAASYVGPTAHVQVQGEKQWRYIEGITNSDLISEQVKSRYFTPGHSYNVYLDLSFPD